MVAGVDIGSTISGAFSGIGDIGGQIITVIGQIIPALLVGGLIAFLGVKILEDVVLYKHKIRLKKLVGNNKLWVEDRAMEKKLKNGAKIWRLKKLRKSIPLPPDDVLMLDGRGKLVAEGYLTDDNHIFWGKDVTDLSEIRGRITTLRAGLKSGQELTTEQQALLSFESNYQPVATNERIVLADEMESAEFGKKDLSKLLEKAIPWIVVITLFVLVIFGFKYYAGPLNDYGKEMLLTIAPIAENNAIAAEYLYAIDKDLQLIKEDLSFLKDARQASNDTG